MPWLNNDIIKLTDYQTIIGEEAVNVWHYELQQDSDAADILLAYETVIIAAMQTIQSTNVFHTRVTIENLTDGGTFAEVAFNPQLQGSRSGALYPSFVAWGFKLVRTTTATRHGQKRVGGVAETDADGNLPLPAFLTTLNAAAAVFGSPVTWDGGASQMTPMIYRPAIAPDPEVRNVVQSAIFTRVTSQNSRKNF